MYYLIYSLLSLNALLLPHSAWSQSDDSEQQALFEILLSDQQPAAIAYDTLRHMNADLSSSTHQQQSYTALKAQIEQGRTAITNTQYHYLLGRLHRDSDSPFYDLGKAEQHFYQAAQDQHPEAAYELAKLYHYNDFFLDYPSALYFYEMSAKEGFRAIWTQKYPKWQKFYVDLAAASEYQLGKLYELGQGVNIDYAKAFEYYQKAARKRHHNATYRIAMIYKTGLGKQIEADPFEAIFWFEKLINPNDPTLTEAEVLQQLDQLYEELAFQR